MTLTKNGFYSMRTVLQGRDLYLGEITPCFISMVCLCGYVGCGRVYTCVGVDVYRLYNRHLLNL